MRGWGGWFARLASLNFPCRPRRDWILLVMGENPSNHIFVDLNVERQGHLLCDSRKALVGITLLHFDDRTDEFCTPSLRCRASDDVSGRTASGTFAGS